MTFDEWWATLDTWEQNRRVKEDAKEAYAAGKREAAETILKLWRDRETPIDFINRLEAYGAIGHTDLKKLQLYFNRSAEDIAQDFG